MLFNSLLDKGFLVVLKKKIRLKLRKPLEEDDCKQIIGVTH